MLMSGICNRKRSMRYLSPSVLILDVYHGMLLLHGFSFLLLPLGCLAYSSVVVYQLWRPYTPGVDE